MRLDGLKIRGFNHFPDTLEINFADLPRGLVALIGPNGGGKTTTVDSSMAGVYGPGKATRAFPSREGNLYTYATSRDAFIETTWSFDDHGRVRTRVNVDAVARKTEATLSIHDGRAWRAVNQNGLVATFSDEVARRFPSLRSVLASAYSAQNRRGGFGDLGQKERVELFAELADLGRYDQMAQTASRCAVEADKAAAQIRAALTLIEAGATPEALEAARGALTAARTTVEDLTLGLRLTTDRIRDAEAQRPAIVEGAEAYRRERARLDAIESTLRAAEVALAENDRTRADYQRGKDDDLRRAETTARDAVAGVTRRRDAERQAMAAASKDRAGRIANNRTLLATAAEVRAAVVAVQEATAAIEQARADEQVARDRERDAVAALAETERRLSVVASAEREIANLTQRAAALTAVKFGAPCGEAPICPLVADAVEARTRLAELEQVRAEGPMLDVARREQTEAVAAAARAVADAVALIPVYQNTITAHRAKADYAPHLDIAEQRIAEYERDEAAAVARLVDLEAAWTAEEVEIARVHEERVREVHARFAERMQEIDAGRRLIEQSITDARADRAAAEAVVTAHAGAEAKLAELDRALEADRVTLHTTEIRIADATAARDRAAAEVATIEAKIARAEGVRTALRAAEDERNAWRALEHLCGRDGIQRLEIDAAGPAVSDIANDLLRVGYGSRFSVEVVTQVATADGKDTKERFTILAIDNDHGGEARDVGDLSGGERVVVEEAIRCALACYVNLRGRVRIRTLFRDETTGALDPEHAPRYVAMLRRMVEMSGAEQVVFITHNPEAAMLADAQIRIAGGRASIALPPFRPLSAEMVGDVAAAVA